MINVKDFISMFDNDTYMTIKFAYSYISGYKRFLLEYFDKKHNLDFYVTSCSLLPGRHQLTIHVGAGVSNV